MKFCKDCKSYRAAVVTSKCFCPASCSSGHGGTGVFDPVTGNENRWSGDPHVLRKADGPCGPDAKWFEPANLDGRLAMLEGE